MIESHCASVTVLAAPDENIFLRFALFDTFRLKKRWKLPVLFACLMSAFALLCFSFRSTKDQAVLLGAVLLSIGLLLPLAWFLLYLSSVRKEARELGLSREKVQYEIQFGETGIIVTRGEERASWLWSEIHAAWRVPSCIYLYVQPDRAFLLPEGQNTDLAWALICRQLPEQRRKEVHTNTSAC